MRSGCVRLGVKSEPIRKEAVALQGETALGVWGVYILSLCRAARKLPEKATIWSGAVRQRIINTTVVLLSRRFTVRYVLLSECPPTHSHANSRMAGRADSFAVGPWVARWARARRC